MNKPNHFKSKFKLQKYNLIDKKALRTNKFSLET